MCETRDSGLRTNIFLGQLQAVYVSIKGRTTRHLFTHFFVIMSTCRRESLRHFHNDAEEEERGLPISTAKSGRTRIISPTQNQKSVRTSSVMQTIPWSTVWRNAAKTSNEESETATLTLSGMREESSQEKSPREAEEGSLTSWRIFFRHFAVLWYVPSYYPLLRKFLGSL